MAMRVNVVRNYHGKDGSSGGHGGFGLFTGIAGCSECHTVAATSAAFTDNLSHHRGIRTQSVREYLPATLQQVVQSNLDASQLEPKVLTDTAWSDLGRFVITHNAADIQAFNMPSLRNVEVTAPYMHNGSIATLAGAVDHEIYYRGLSGERAINLTEAEREEIVAFLRTLTDEHIDSPASVK